MNVTYDFSGKNVLLIGGTTGIGRATALAFAKSGANLFMTGLGKDAGRGRGQGRARQFWRRDRVRRGRRPRRRRR